VKLPAPKFPQRPLPAHRRRRRKYSFNTQRKGGENKSDPRRRHTVPALLNGTMETPPGTGLPAAPRSCLTGLPAAPRSCLFWRCGQERREVGAGENQGCFPGGYSTRRGERLWMAGKQLPRPEEMAGVRGWGWSTGPPTRLCLGMSRHERPRPRVARRKGWRKRASDVTGKWERWRKLFHQARLCTNLRVATDGAEYTHTHACKHKIHTLS
jgi:hypothetical protein